MNDDALDTNFSNSNIIIENNEILKDYISILEDLDDQNIQKMKNIIKKFKPYVE